MNVLNVTVFIVIASALIWAILAWNAGMFIPHDKRYAIEPSSFSDVMAADKKIISLKDYKIACIDIGSGEPVILLHGCPFSVYEWREVLPFLAKHFRVIAPDLLGLGDTPVKLNDDYRLPEDVKMIQELMDHLGIKSARFIGHDHGGAIVQLLMQHDPSRIDMAILTNVEAYDQWPSKPEIPDVKLITNFFTSPLIFHAFKFRALQRDLYSIAVADPSTLTDETLDGFSKQHLMSALRWQRLRIFLSWQLDKQHNQLTQEAVPAMKKFNKPVLIVWGEQDTNFDSEIARRLAKDIPGVAGLHWMKKSAHLPMLEEPEEYNRIALDFFSHNKVDSAAQISLAEARK